MDYFRLAQNDVAFNVLSRQLDNLPEPRRNVAFDKPASYSFGNGHNSKPGLAVDECRNLRWGDLCENKCGHCLDDYCYDWNGYCKNGCESGYKTTDKCLDAGCNKVDGACNGCADGLKGKFCECEDGRFGKGCFGTCGHCLDGLACNKTTGFCDQGCAPGWTALPTCKHGEYNM
ncbi:hypothetical protein MAR_023240 [Mya arenaria]|uniref:Uncharacterized protein n=1 Tax=Mya arenaria TaxID=6604 RepID=A0ABY7DQ69_MYAAR|nr:hypothetical protein MAR_023240 [Mya arenaria]